MTSIDQAFIKAFARRGRRPSNESASADSALPSQADQPTGELRVDPSVAETAKVWVDPIEDQLLRADAPSEDAVPQPHHQVAHQRITPSEHFRSEFVFGTVADQEPTESVDDNPIIEELEEQDSDQTQQTDEATPAQDEPAPLESVDTNSPAAIEPAWEVDSFEVPNAVEQLFFEEGFFHSVANHMKDAVADGLKSLVVTSAQSGEGRSTVAIGVALAAAATGLRVALVDGDTEDPTLVDDLRLDLEYGWVDTLRGGLHVNQIAVHSIDDNVTLIPLMPPQGKSAGATDTEVEQLLETLTDQFDLVVVDGPSCAMPRVQQFAALVDTAIIAQDSSRTDSSMINELSYRLRESGVQGVGIVQNFN